MMDIRDAKLIAESLKALPEPYDRADTRMTLFRDFVVAVNPMLAPIVYDSRRAGEWQEVTIAMHTKAIGP